MSKRRPTHVSPHEYQHELLITRRDEFRAAPRGRKNSIESVRRRDKAKAYRWTLIGHLRQYHLDTPSVPLHLDPIEALERLHEGYHADD